jgi:hypothetical protein
MEAAARDFPAHNELVSTYIRNGLTFFDFRIKSRQYRLRDEEIERKLQVDELQLLV